jgi:hypothetical protein
MCQLCFPHRLSPNPLHPPRAMDLSVQTKQECESEFRVSFVVERGAICIARNQGHKRTGTVECKSLSMSTGTVRGHRMEGRIRTSNG